MNRKKIIVFAAAAVVIALLLYWGLVRGTAVHVDTSPVKRGPMAVTVDGEGKTRARVKTTITAPIAGKMSRIRLLEGDNIPHDFPITEIDPDPPVQRFPDRFDDRPNLRAANKRAKVSLQPELRWSRSAILTISRSWSIFYPPRR